jgi:hypothetical protein
MDKDVGVVHSDTAAVGHVPPSSTKKLTKQLSRSMTGTSLPDASIPVKKLVYALLAISLGTVIEWFDFSGKLK